jgi:glycosyltransferase involved in cell wall biosynthesis
MMQEQSLKPLLIISDGISGSSGLARIARDLSTRIHDNLSDVYRVGVAGYGAPGSRRFGFSQYHLGGMDGWIMPSLPEIIEDFAGSDRCIIFPIFDLHRLSWFSQPERLGAESLAKYPGLQKWLLSANIEKWCYVPIDSSGPNDRLSFPIALTALGFDRLLAYGEFGEGVLRRSIGDEEADKRHLTNLPHGIDASVFHEMPRFMARKLFFQTTHARSMLAMLGVSPETAPIADDEMLVGIVATNQSRKDWALGLETCALLARKRKVRVWVHIDELERYWSLPSLLVDYGLIGSTVISTGYVPDAKMAKAYAACDATLGIGPEGFGFCIAESMACGTPCITGSYANGSVLVPKSMQVDPVAFRYEGSFASKRPIYRAEDWAAKVEEWVGKRASLDPRYDWGQNWIAWEKYLREAAK